MAKISTLRTVKNIRGAGQLYSSRKSLFQMLREAFHGKYKMSFLTVMALILGVLYIISPLDFDWVPVIGWVDDGFVFYLLIKRLQTETHRFNRHKAMERRLNNN